MRRARALLTFVLPLSFWPAFAVLAAVPANESTRSTEHPSPMGIYEELKVHSRLTLGTSADAPDMSAAPPTPNPSGAAEGLITVNGNLLLRPLNADSPLEGNASEREINIEEALEVGLTAFRTKSLVHSKPFEAPYEKHYFGIGFSDSLVNGIEAELHVSGDVRAYGYRASFGDLLGAAYDDQDQLLYFRGAADGQAIEMGSRWKGDWSDGQSICRLRGDPKIVLNWFSRGFVGIGTENPTHIFQVGDPGSGLKVIAHQYVGYCTRAIKKDISPLSSEDYAGFLQKLASTDVVRFRYKGDAENTPKTLGVIAEEAPREIVDKSQKWLSHGDTIAYIYAVIRQLKLENDALEYEVSRLEQEQGLLGRRSR